MRPALSRILLLRLLLVFGLTAPGLCADTFAQGPSIGMDNPGSAINNSLGITLEQVREAQRLQQEALKELADEEALSNIRQALDEEPGVQHLQFPSGQGTSQTQPVRIQSDESRKLLEQQLLRARQLLEHPLIKQLSAVALSSEFLKSIDQLQKHPRLRLFFQLELLCFILLFIVRARMLARPGHWARKLWTRAWTFFFIPLTLGIALPILVLGSPFMQVAGPVMIVFWKYLIK